MNSDDRKQITDLQREGIDVDRAILKAIHRWQLATMYIAVILTIALLVQVTGN